MKKYKVYIILMIIGSLLLISMLAVKENLDKERKSILAAQQFISTSKSEKQNKETFTYSQIIHLVNKYNGQIKEFKTEDKNSKFVNAEIIIENNKNSIFDFLEEIKKSKNLYKINSLILNNIDLQEEHCELNIAIEFKV